MTSSIGLSGFAGGVAAARQSHTPPAPSVKPNEASYGDVTLSKFTRFHRDGRRGTIVFTGPSLVIQSRDTTQPTQFRLQADEVTLKPEKTGKNETWSVDLTGSIRYTIKQQTKQGVRTLQGAAGHAAYNQAQKRIYLTEGVQASMTQEATLEGTATLRSSSATILTDRSEHYELTGDPAVNEIRVTPRRKAKAKGDKNGKNNKEAQSIAGAPIHLYGFRNGVIEMGHSIVVTGATPTVDIVDPVENSAGSLTAERITANFDTSVTHAEAKGSVHFHYDRANPDQKAKTGGRQSLTGHGDTATYDADQHRLTVSGNVEADIVDPQSLLEPAHLVAGQVTMHTEEPVKPAQPAAAQAATDTPPQIRYEISGAPERTSLVFHPRPKERNREQKQQGKADGPAVTGGPPDKAMAKPNAMQSFAIGVFHITGFDKGVYLPGQNAVLTGDGTTFRTEDKKARTSSVLRASHLTATLGVDQALQQVEALGNVRFELVQPMPTKAEDTEVQQTTLKTSSGSKPGASALTIQTTKATTTQAILLNTDEGQILKVAGPWRINQTTEDPDKLYVTSGEKGDTLTWNLTTNTQDGDSPNKTIAMATIDVRPQTAQKKVVAPPSKSQSPNKRNR